MVEPTSGPPPIFGVTVEQYAGVNAAVLEGFRLPEVLASARLLVTCCHHHDAREDP